MTGRQPLDEDERVARQAAADRNRRERPQPRQEPPDEPAARRTPTWQEILHRAEALACVEPPVDAPPTPMNDLGKIGTMARMGGDVEVLEGGSVSVTVNGGLDVGRLALGSESAARTRSDEIEELIDAAFEDAGFSVRTPGGERRERR